MKKNKYGDVTACCWGYRHELLGVLLLVLAAILTIVTGNGLGIFAMFIVGLGLCCRGCFHHHCCHTDLHCHAKDADGEILLSEQPIKKNPG